MRTMNRSIARTLAIAAATACIGLPGAAFAAQVLTWDGGAGSTDTTWTTGTNWVGDPTVVTSDPTTTITIPSASFTTNQNVGVASPDFFQLKDLTVANSTGATKVITGRLDFTDVGSYNLSGTSRTELNGTGSLFQIQAGRTVTLNNSNANANNFVVGLTGGGTLIAKGSGFMNYGVSNAFSGTIRSEGGTFQPTSGTWQPTTSALLQVAGGTLRGRATVVMGTNLSVELENNFRWDAGNALTMAGPVSITTGDAGVTIDLEGGSNLRIISGVVSGAGKSLTLTDDSSNLQFTGTSPNTYSGGTILNNVGGGAKLRVSKDGGLGAGDVTLNAGAALTLDSGTTHDYIGDSADLLLNGTELQTKVNLNFTGTDTIAGLFFDGVSQSAGLWGATDNLAATFKSDYFSGTGLISVVPEPTALGLLGAGALLLGSRRRRNQM